MSDVLNDMLTARNKYCFGLSYCFDFLLKYHLTSILPLYFIYIKLVSISSVILYCVQSFIFSFEKVLLKPYGFSGILFAVKAVRSTI